jgi:hypothetical protein
MRATNKGCSVKCADRLELISVRRVDARGHSGKNLSGFASENLIRREAGVTQDVQPGQ